MLQMYYGFTIEVVNDAFRLCLKNFSAEPNFVSMYEVGNYIYIFFREVAIEYINCGKASYFRRTAAKEQFFILYVSVFVSCPTSETDL